MLIDQQTNGKADLSTSPETTFSNAKFTSNRKQSMVTNLLSETNSAGSSLDDAEHYNGVDREGDDDCSPKKVQDIVNSNEQKREQHQQQALNGTQTKCDRTNQSNVEKLLTLNVNDLLACDERDNKKLCNMDSNNSRRAGGYLIAVHRKLSRQDTYFLSYHKTRPSVFGVPLLIPCYEDGTNKDLYCAVWIQVARLLSPLPSTPPDQANHATDW